MKRILLSACAVLIVSAIGIFFVVYGRLQLAHFKASDEKQLSSNVVLHRTSRTMVTLTDGEGMGIVQGSVKRIGFAPGGKQYLLVAFEPFSKASGLEIAKVELATGEFTIIPDPDDVIRKSLESIDSFF
jgi:hypothetical protein